MGQKACIITAASAADNGNNRGSPSESKCMNELLVKCIIDFCPGELSEYL